MERRLRVATTTEATHVSAAGRGPPALVPALCLPHASTLGAASRDSCSGVGCDHRWSTRAQRGHHCASHHHSALSNRREAHSGRVSRSPPSGVNANSILRPRAAHGPVAALSSLPAANTAPLRLQALPPTAERVSDGLARTRYSSRMQMTWPPTSARMPEKGPRVGPNCAGVRSAAKDRDSDATPRRGQRSLSTSAQVSGRL